MRPYHWRSLLVVVTSCLLIASLIVTDFKGHHTVRRLMEGDLEGWRPPRSDVKRNEVTGYPCYSTPQVEDHENTTLSSVLILAYQRTGSSFFGKLFDKNPKALYLYEPLDALYTARYGTRDGWNVPGDIHFYWNGTKRHLPEKEVDAVVEYLRKLYSCGINSLPREFIVHRFWSNCWSFMTGLSPIRDCIKAASKLEARNKLCYHFISRMCPKRFGMNHTEHEYCHRMLSQRMRELKVSPRGINLRPKDNFTLYHECVAKQRTFVISCENILERKCRNSNLRVIKTVRASMESVEALLNKDPKVKVIHLIRDPRPVVLSRRRDASFRSHFSGKHLVKEAEIYCQRALHDVYHRRKLQKRYPASFLQVIYDQFVERPLEYASMIYKFVGRDLSPEVEIYLRNMKEKNISSNIAQRWQTKLSYYNATAISAVCRELFYTVDHGSYWP